MIMIVSGYLLLLVSIVWMSFYYNYFLALWGMYRSYKSPKAYGHDEPHWFIIQITTAGKAPRSVMKMIEHIRRLSLKINYELWIVTEPGDTTNYNVDRLIIVPKDFVCNSAYKARALEYARRIRRHHFDAFGIDPHRTKILYLDDDCFPEKEYIESAFYSDLDIGQGRLQSDVNYGVSVIASVADNFKATDCFATCSTFGSLGKPINVHGEGMFVRGNVEQDITWEVGGSRSLGEDYIFGTRAAKKYKFGLIPYVLHEGSLLSIHDLFKQRRRWYSNNSTILKNSSNWQKVTIAARIYGGYTGLPSVALVIYLTLMRATYPLPIDIIFLIGTGLFVSYYLIGAWINTHSYKRVIQTLFTFWLAAMIESSFIYLSLIFKPKTFDVTPKDLPFDAEGIVEKTD